MKIYRLYNLKKERNVLKVFDEMIADIEAYNKLNPIVTEMFMGGQNFNMWLLFTWPSYFKVSKDI